MGGAKKKLSPLLVNENRLDFNSLLSLARKCDVFSYRKFTNHKKVGVCKTCFSEGGSCHYDFYTSPHLYKAQICVRGGCKDEGGFTKPFEIEFYFIQYDYLQI